MLTRCVAVEPFKNELICPSVLKKVLERDVVRHIKLKDDRSVFIYERVSGARRAGYGEGRIESALSC